MLVQANIAKLKGINLSDYCTVYIISELEEQVSAVHFDGAVQYVSG